jgi:tRNA U55 pseudouridine synthase TruB
MKIDKPAAPTADEVFRKVKRVYQARLVHAGMTDEDVKEVIKKIASGTRNHRYLAPTGKLHERRDIISFIMREMEV